MYFQHYTFYSSPASKSSGANVNKKVNERLAKDDDDEMMRRCSKQKGVSTTLLVSFLSLSFSLGRVGRVVLRSNTQRVAFSLAYKEEEEEEEELSYLGFGSFFQTLNKKYSLQFFLFRERALRDVFCVRHQSSPVTRFEEDTRKDTSSSAVLAK